MRSVRRRANGNERWFDECHFAKGIMRAGYLYWRYNATGCVWFTLFRISFTAACDIAAIGVSLKNATEGKGRVALKGHSDRRRQGEKDRAIQTQQRSSATLARGDDPDNWLRTWKRIHICALARATLSTGDIFYRWFLFLRVLSGRDIPSLGFIKIFRIEWNDDRHDSQKYIKR